MDYLINILNHILGADLRLKFGSKGADIAGNYYAVKQAINDSKATRIDDSDPNNTYLGYAPAGTSESATNWKIEKITNTPYAIYQATGAWDNRYNLTYL